MNAIAPTRRTAHTASEPLAGRYRLIKTLGQGGMGVVYLAEDLATGQRCAVKRVRPDKAGDPVALGRFEAEIAALGCSFHAGIARLLDEGTTCRGARFFAMEYVAGKNLDSTVRRHGAFSTKKAIRILRHLCQALAALHRRGVVHRDVKPANIMLAGRAERAGAVKLVDFGLAQFIDAQDGDGRLVGDDSFAGSPLYAAPETFTGRADERSDIYALGATAYFLLTGRPVFDAVEPLDAIAAHVNCLPTSPRRWQPAISRRLDSIVMRCLDKDPQERFQSAAELDAALAALESDDREIEPGKADKSDRVAASDFGDELLGETMVFCARMPGGRHQRERDRLAPSSAG